MITNEQLIKILAAYYGRTFTFYRNDEPARCYIGGTIWDDYVTEYKSLIDVRPVSAITDEEAIQVACLALSYVPYVELLPTQIEGAIAVTRDDTHIKVRFKQVTRYASIRIHFENCDISFNKRETDTHTARLYLQSIGVDIPVFIAPGHPDNGKTLKDLGYAEY